MSIVVFLELFKVWNFSKTCSRLLKFKTESWSKLFIKYKCTNNTVVYLTALGEVPHPVCHPLPTSLWTGKALLTASGQLPHGIPGRRGRAQTGPRYESPCSGRRAVSSAVPALWLRLRGASVYCLLAREAVDFSYILRLSRCVFPKLWIPSSSRSRGFLGPWPVPWFILTV